MSETGNYKQSVDETFGSQDYKNTCGAVSSNTTNGGNAQVFGTSATDSVMFASLQQYSDSLRAGNKSVFDEVSQVYAKKMNDIQKQMDEYIEIANIAMQNIAAAMEQDKNARVAAQRAYDAKMNNPIKSTYKSTINGKVVEYQDIDVEATKKAAQEAYDSIWKKQSWWETHSCSGT